MPLLGKLFCLCALDRCAAFFAGSCFERVNPVFSLAIATFNFLLSHDSPPWFYKFICFLMRRTIGSSIHFLTTILSGFDPLRASASGGDMIVGRGVRLSFMHLFFSSPSAMSSPLLSFRRYLPTVTERKYLVSISPASPSYYIRSLSPATRGFHELSEAVRPASGKSSPTS